MQDYHARLTNNNLKWVENRSFNGALYHYTKQNVASSVISSTPPLIRSYDIWTMADINEFHFSFEEFFKLAKKRNLFQYIQPVENFYQNELTNPVLRYFVSSFTDTHLKHKHWKHYAQGHTGVCFKLLHDDALLVGKGAGDMLMGGNIIYDQTIQMKLLNKLLNHYKANVKRILHGFTQPQLAHHFSQLNLGLYQALVIYGVLFKTRKFKWEDEYRLISMVSNPSLIKLCQVTNRHYVNLSISTRSELYIGKKNKNSFPNCPLATIQL